MPPPLDPAPLLDADPEPPLLDPDPPPDPEPLLLDSEPPLEVPLLDSEPPPDDVEIPPLPLDSEPPLDDAVADPSRRDPTPELASPGSSSCVRDPHPSATRAAKLESASMCFICHSRRVVHAGFAVAARIAASVAVDGYPPPLEAGPSSPLSPPLELLLPPPDEDDPLDEVRPSSPTRKPVLLVPPSQVVAKTAAVSAPPFGQSFPNRTRCLRSCSPGTPLTPWCRHKARIRQLPWRN